MSDELKNVLGTALALKIGEKLMELIDEVTVSSEKWTTTEVCHSETYIPHECRPLNARWWKLRTEVSVPEVTVYETGDIEAGKDVEVRMLLQSPRHRKTLFSTCLHCVHLENEGDAQ